MKGIVVMNIKYKPMITITADELDRIITEKYPEVPVDITDDLFPEGYSNDCYKTLYIADDYLAEEFTKCYKDKSRKYFIDNVMIFE